MTWITLLILLDGSIAGAIPYPDRKSCGDALPIMAQALKAAHGEVTLQCRDSGIAKIRPQARP
jgi:hypothetical protein